MILGNSKISEVEELLTQITNTLYNQKVISLPKFALLNDWFAVVWQEEEVDEEISNSWIDEEKFQVISNVTSELSSNPKVYIAFATRELNESNKPLPRVILELPMLWENILNYECELENTPSQFYVFDETLSWFIHVDDSVMLAGSISFFTRFTKCNGGFKNTKEMFNKYLSEVTSSNTITWVNSIRERYIKNKGQWLK